MGSIEKAAVSNDTLLGQFLKDFFGSQGVMKLGVEGADRVCRFLPVTVQLGDHLRSQNNRLFITI